MAKKLFLIICVSCFCVLSAHGQTKIKANALYWVVGVLNVSAETYAFADKFTVNADLVYSPWNSVDGNALRFLQIIPELRYYPKGAFNGFYTGAYFSWHDFKLTKWNYRNTGKYQKGNGYSVGAVIGYQTPISEKWSIDIYAGGGYQNSGYRGYDRKTGEMYVGWNSSGEWMPYKLGVAFAYTLGR